MGPLKKRPTDPYRLYEFACQATAPKRFRNQTSGNCWLGRTNPAPSPRRALGRLHYCFRPPPDIAPKKEAILYQVRQILLGGPSSQKVRWPRLNRFLRWREMRSARSVAKSAQSSDARSHALQASFAPFHASVSNFFVGGRSRPRLPPWPSSSSGLLSSVHLGKTDFCGRSLRRPSELGPL